MNYLVTVSLIAGLFTTMSHHPHWQVKEISAETKAPALQVENWTNTTKQALTLQDFHGKMVVLAFIYTNCCSFQNGAEKLNDLQKRYPDVVFIGVHSSETGTLDLKAVAKTYKISWLLAEDIEDKTRSAYEKLDPPQDFRSGAPRYFLIDTAGRVRTSVLSSDELEPELSRLLNRKASL